MRALLLMAALALLPLAARADEAQADALLAKLLAAQDANDYEAFLADGSAELKAALTKAQFDQTCVILAKAFDGGYVKSYLGELRQKGHEVYLFRLRLNKGGDDVLAVLSLKDGKIGGIYFK